MEKSSGAQQTKKPFACEVKGCGKAYETLRMLRRHRSNRHDGADADRECNVCGTVLKLKSSMKKHLRSHVCEYCGESFAKLDDHREHCAAAAAQKSKGAPEKADCSASDVKSSSSSLEMKVCKGEMNGAFDSTQISPEAADPGTKTAFENPPANAAAPPRKARPPEAYTRKEIEDLAEELNRLVPAVDPYEMDECETCGMAMIKAILWAHGKECLILCGLMPEGVTAEQLSCDKR